MKKQIWFTLVVILFMALLVVGCSVEQETKIGEVSESKDDETAIKEVVTAFYNEYKNFKWESFNKESGLEFWTAEGREQYLAEGADSLAESVKKQEISTQLQNIDFKELKVEGEQAVVKLVAYEQCASEVAKNLNGEFQGHDHLELRKEEGTWRIQSRTSQLLKFAQ